MLSEMEIVKIIDDLLAENEKLVKERGKAAFGALMGFAMRKIRGRAKAELVSRVLREKLEKIAGKF